jgi:hypothetical protein
MRAKLQILKDWVDLGQVKTAHGRRLDDLKTLINQMEIELIKQEKAQSTKPLSDKK